MSADRLDEACRALGISDTFVDNWGTERRSSRDAVQAVVRAMHSGSLCPSDARPARVAVVRPAQQLMLSWTVEAARADAVPEATNPRLIVLADVDDHVGSSKSSVPAAHAVAYTLSWTITAETGDRFSGDVCLNSSKNVNPVAGPVESFATCQIKLPESLPPGYHQLIVTGQPKHGAGDCSDIDIETVAIQLVLVPAKAWNPNEPDTLPLRGVALQLYSLRSHSNWGIGDFSDLEKLCSKFADNGFHAVGLNPLHALFPAHPQRCSPYSPSSRNFLNPIYIDVTRVPLAKLSPGFVKLIKSTEFVARLEQARHAETVDYALVMSLKLQALYEIFLHIYSQDEKDKTSSGDQEKEEVNRDFLKFWHCAGTALVRHAEFQAFDEYLSAEHQCNDWHDWPEAYRNPDSPDSRHLAEQLILRVKFYVFLQWIAEAQLGDVAKYCQALGMRYGLYMDLAVGVDFRAGDTWANQDLYAGGVHVGAPPDELGPLGQDWQLTPYNPKTLAHFCYAPIVEMLRANMQFAGVLRLDHVMGFLRQYWCTPSPADNPVNNLSLSQDAVNGCYVEFPFNDLIGIVALESHRNQCVIIGEDLGTVPDGFREDLETQGILGYRVLYFERNEKGAYISPSKYIRQSLATASTHDLPTLAGYFLSNDIKVRSELGHYSDEHSECVEQQQRRASIVQLLSCVKEVMSARTENRESIERCDALLEQLEKGDISPGDTECFVHLIHYLISTAGSQLIMLQLDDLLLQKDMVNMPGTVHSYPNWKGRLQHNLDELSAFLSESQACLPRSAGTQTTG